MQGNRFTVKPSQLTQHCSGRRTTRPAKKPLAEGNKMATEGTKGDKVYCSRFRTKGKSIQHISAEKLRAPSQVETFTLRPRITSSYLLKAPA